MDGDEAQKAAARLEAQKRASLYWGICLFAEDQPDLELNKKVNKDGTING